MYLKEERHSSHEKGRAPWAAPEADEACNRCYARRRTRGTLIGNQLNINDSSASAEPFARDTRCSRRYV
jgi:hypothetical protein